MSDAALFRWLSRMNVQGACADMAHLKVGDRVIENARTWPKSGFEVAWKIGEGVGEVLEQDAIHPYLVLVMWPGQPPDYPPRAMWALKGYLLPAEKSAVAQAKTVAP